MAKKTVKRTAATKSAQKTATTPANTASPATAPANQQPDRLISAYIPFPNSKEEDIKLLNGRIADEDHNTNPNPKNTARNVKVFGKKAKTPVHRLAQRKKLFVEAMVQALGIVSKAARISGIPPRTHYFWMESDMEYQAAIIGIKEVTLDFYEDALHQLIKDKHPAAIIFALKTQGKRRGYIESSNHIPVTNDDNVQFYLPDNNRDRDITDATIVP